MSEPDDERPVRNAPLVRNQSAVQQVLPLESPASDSVPLRQMLADIATTAGTLERYAIHVADEGASESFTSQAFELGVIKALAKRVVVLARRDAAA